MCVAAILFCLTLFSAHLTSGLYAKYITTESGSDAARVITFGDLTLSETGDFYAENKLMIIPGVDLTKKATVDFSGSEAETYVFVEVEASSKWQTTDNYTFFIVNNGKTAMQWRIAEGWTLLASENGAYVYYRKLAPNSALNNVDIIAEGGRIEVSDRITKSEIESMTGISIKLRAAVVQSGGFENPEAAWNSVAAKEG
ncbi:MAG: hypothetical protein J6R49_01830 [Clostridia bacterium]|nr:hypothetical protein [Clostridia bacterium]